MSRIAMLALVAAMVSTAACAGRGSPTGSLTDDMAAEETGETDVTIQVASHNPRDVTIFLLVGSSRYRLGMATGNSTTFFKVKWERIANASVLHLLGEQMGDDDKVESDTLQLRPGGRVLWTLEADLGRSIDSTY